MTVAASSVDRDRLLAAAVEVAHHRVVAGHLVLANDDCNSRADATGAAQLAVEPALGHVEHGPRARASRSRRAMLAAASACAGSTEQTSTSAARLDAGNGAQRAGDHEDPLDAERVAGCRRGREAEQLGEPVVAASPTERALRALEGVVPELEDGVAVVVEPAHQPVVADRVDPGRLQVAQHGGEVRRGSRASSESQSSGASATSPASRLQSSRRSGLVCSRRRQSSHSDALERRVVRDQRGAVSSPVLGAAERVDLELDAGDARAPRRSATRPR